MTSSPGPISIASSTSTIASVPFATPTAFVTPRYAAASSWKGAWSWGISGAYCALTSISGIGDTASPHCSQPVEEIRRSEDDACHDGVLDVLEAVVEALVARSQRVADPRA